MNKFNDIGKGALFVEGDGVLNGNVEIAGGKIRIAGVKRTTKSGRTIISIQEEVGALFLEEQKTRENGPDYTGSCKLNGQEVRVAAWNSTSQDGTNYLSLKLTEKQQPDMEADAHQPAKVNQDDIPF